MVSILSCSSLADARWTSSSRIVFVILPQETGLYHPPRRVHPLCFDINIDEGPCYLQLVFKISREAINLYEFFKQNNQPDEMGFPFFFQFCCLPKDLHALNRPAQ